jgi:hypothetical protein
VNYQQHPLERLILLLAVVVVVVIEYLLH